MKEQSRRYEVQTYWGWFSLDEASYQDYLEGKLWISWEPGGRRTKKAAPVEPAHVSAEAIRLWDSAEKLGVYALLQELYPGEKVEIPYLPRMEGLSIEELCLSVRASNGLMRAGASDFGKLFALIGRENGLKTVRNLGVKSEKEILTNFLTATYAQLSGGEKAQFWQELLEKHRTLEG